MPYSSQLSHRYQEGHFQPYHSAPAHTHASQTITGIYHTCDMSVIHTPSGLMSGHECEEGWRSEAMMVEGGMRLVMSDRGIVKGGT